MRVLNLVTSAESTCYRQQVRTLESMGVDCTTLSVSESRAQDDESVERRSVGQWASFFGDAVSETFGDYDLVHANYGLTAPAAVVQPTLPTVVSLWGSDLMGTPAPLSKVCARFADAVVVMSSEMAAELPCDAHVIPHGVDTDTFEPVPRQEARRELDWDVDTRYVLFPYAAARTVKNYPRAKRVSDAAAARLDGDVVLRTVSGVAHERMALYLSAADVVLMTSDREGSPNTITEALACNVPVVSTDVGDVADQLDGVAPSRVCQSDAELVEALVEVLETGGRSNGRRKVERELSAERTGERLLGVYESVLNRTGDTPRGRIRPRLH